MAIVVLDACGHGLTPDGKGMLANIVYLGSCIHFCDKLPNLIFLFLQACALPYQATFKICENVPQQGLCTSYSSIIYTNLLKHCVNRIELTQHDITHKSVCKPMHNPEKARSQVCPRQILQYSLALAQNNSMGVDCALHWVLSHTWPCP